MSEFNGAVLSVQFEKYPELHSIRRDNAKYLDTAFQQIDGINPVNEDEYAISEKTWQKIWHIALDDQKYPRFERGSKFTTIFLKIIRLLDFSEEDEDGETLEWSDFEKRRYIDGFLSDIFNYSEYWEYFGLNYDGNLLYFINKYKVDLRDLPCQVFHVKLGEVIELNERNRKKIFQEIYEYSKTIHNGEFDLPDYVKSIIGIKK